MITRSSDVLCDSVFRKFRARRICQLIEREAESEENKKGISFVIVEILIVSDINHHRTWHTVLSQTFDCSLDKYLILSDDFIDNGVETFEKID